MVETPSSALLTPRPGTGPDQGIFREGERWESRPVAAVGADVAIRLGPAVVAVVVTLIAALLAPRPHGLLFVPWWLALIAISQVVLRAGSHLARQFLALPPMLRLSLVFPDLAPSRLAMARRATDGAALDELTRVVASEGLPRPVDEALEASVLLVAALSRHDRTTRWHSERVLAFSELIAAQLDLERIPAEKLRWGALLHDLGKLTVSAEILNAESGPTDNEWTLLRRHPVEAERLMAPLTRWLGDALKTAAQHHERWDGKGYPRGLSGQQTTLNARIVAVADAFAVMTAAPSYRAQQSLSAARAELQAHAGTQFDPTVVEALLAVSDLRLAMAAGLRSTAYGLAVVGPRLMNAPKVPRLLPSGVGAVLLSAILLSGLSPSPLRWATPLRDSGRASAELALTDSVPTDSVIGAETPVGGSDIIDLIDVAPVAGSGDFVTGNVAATTTTTSTLPPPTTLPPTLPPTTVAPTTAAPAPPVITVAALPVPVTTNRVTTTTKAVTTTTARAVTTTKAPKGSTTVPATIARGTSLADPVSSAVPLTTKPPVTTAAPVTAAATSAPPPNTTVASPPTTAAPAVFVPAPPPDTSGGTTPTTP